MFYDYEAQREGNLVKLYIVAPMLNLQGKEISISTHSAENEGLTSTDDYAQVEADFAQVESDYAPTDELISACGSDDDEGNGPKHQEFIPSKDLGEKEIAVGMKFATAADFRLALREIAVKKRFDLKFKRNDGDRISEVCKGGCGWKIFASKPDDEDCLIVKTYVPEHNNCLWFYTNGQATSTYLANKYLEQVRINPGMPTNTLKRTIASELDIDVSDYKVRRAKRKALDVVEGNEVEQYEKMREYAHLIFTSNPGSVVKIQTEPTAEENGPYGGHLLSAVSIDGNEQMFPVAFVVVESETRDSWSWFMSELMDAVGPYQEITFISDRQKGLVDTFENIMDGSDHRYCVRHLYENFKLRFKGQQLKNELWEAARSFTEADFDVHMRNIKVLNAEAYGWLHNVPPEFWSKSRFTYQSKSDMVINNMCESWNAVILQARDKPIIYMLEWIRRHLMLRFQKKREWMESKDGLLCPEIQKNLNKVKRQARMCKVLYAGYNKYDVEYFGIGEAVDLEKKTCSCKIWNLTGIPCRHVVACIFLRKDLPESYVDPYYYRETYLKAYYSLIHPFSMRQLLKAQPSNPLLPPTFSKPTRRPKKARSKKNDEPSTSTKLSRSKQQLKCSKCQVKGHNSRTCKLSAPLVIEKPPPKKGGRPPIIGRGKGQPVRGRGRRGERGRVARTEIPTTVPSNQSQEVQNITFSQLASTQASSSRSMMDNDYACW
ncbi:uncharacterized protein LOC132296203 [Cornus florida]|uniref:uncharacterized protein LOC132296203 n=1 Tax=Cornus florida TaxID=4283 RepID=UPI00289C2B91|nr:uncharacterized protein LOC132296203 [Cornus florida]